MGIDIREKTYTTMTQTDEQKLYAVALTFSGEIEEIINDLRDGFQEHMKYSEIPHLTLVYPFAPLDGIDSVNARLAETAGRIRPFRLIMKGIEFFEGSNNIAYIAVADKPPVMELYRHLNESLEGLTRDIYAGLVYDFDEFTPHMTIGERIPGDIFPEVKKRYAGVDVYYAADITDFGLFSLGNLKKVSNFILTG